MKLITADEYNNSLKGNNANDFNSVDIDEKLMELEHDYGFDIFRLPEGQQLPTVSMDKIMHLDKFLDFTAAVKPKVLFIEYNTVTERTYKNSYAFCALIRFDMYFSNRETPDSDLYKVNWTDDKLKMLWDEMCSFTKRHMKNTSLKALTNKNRLWPTDEVTLVVPYNNTYFTYTMYNKVHGSTTIEGRVANVLHLTGDSVFNNVDHARREFDVIKKRMLDE